MISFIKDIVFDSNAYDVIITIIAISLAFTTMYNKIKYFCLEKAAEKVAEVEKDKELTGSQKFAKVVLWINQELPKLFKNKLFNIIIEKLVNYSYNTSKEYAINYIKRIVEGLIPADNSTSELAFNIIIDFLSENK